MSDENKGKNLVDLFDMKGMSLTDRSGVVWSAVGVVILAAVIFMGMLYTAL